jgi:hypothetical protein
MPRIEEPAEPWRSFFADVDSRLSEDVQLHCCGGFVAVTVATPPENYEEQLLARAGHLRADVLKERYYAELRPNLLAHEGRHDLTLRLWLESYWPV